jgi:PAH dioxygenase large subunit
MAVQKTQMTPSPQGWVDVTRGLVDRKAFISDDIYQLEIERIFNRTWIFLAHESEIPAPGDYVVRTLGSAPVVVVRDDNGEMRALLNSCRHRGTKVCRADSGNTRRFVCPYHGWSYERDGRLITTTFDRHLPKDIDFSELGLVPVTRLADYRGLIFGSWNPDVVDLAEYIGDIGWYLDAFFARTPGGLEILAPPHRWRAKANWKVGALNFVGDSQHIVTTHIGPITLDPVRAARAGFAKVAEDSFQVTTDAGHGCTVSYLAPGLPEEAYNTHPRDLEPLYKQMLQPEQVALLRHLRVIVGTVFPNLSFIESQVGPGEKAIIMRLWHPIGGDEMEIRRITKPRFSKRAFIISAPPGCSSRTTSSSGRRRLPRATTPLRRSTPTASRPVCHILTSRRLVTNGLAESSGRQTPKSPSSNSCGAGTDF